MLSQSITPAMLATQPKIIHVVDFKYSHEEQCGIGAGNTVTFNGTQTFDVYGKPKDNDND